MNPSDYDRDIDWTLEIIPAHAEQVAMFNGLVEEIYITMIPGSTAIKSIEAIRFVKNAGFQPVPHIAARNFNNELELEDFLAEVDRIGIRKALILAGGQSTANGPYSETLDILRSKAFSKSKLGAVCIAGHPEGNPEDTNAMQSLEKKLGLLAKLGIATEIVTQWSFSPDKVSRYISNLRLQNINSPVRVGVAGPASLKTLLKYAKICGVNAATGVIKKQGFNLARLLVSNSPETFTSKIVGSANFHLYLFGGLSKGAQWLKGHHHAPNTLPS